MAKAASKIINPTNGTELIEDVLSKYDYVNDLTADLKEAKEVYKEAADRIVENSMAVFNYDLEQDIPALYGNHDYVADSGRAVTVNFKQKPGGISFKNVGTEPVVSYLTGVLGSGGFKKLFKAEAKVTLEEIPEKAAKEDTDLLSLRAKPGLTDRQKYDLYKDYPDIFTLTVRDHEGFIKHCHGLKIPCPVDIEVSPQTGFIGKMAKANDLVREKLKDLTKAIIKATVTTAVKCNTKVG